jgi:hypothetical protein
VTNVNKPTDISARIEATRARLKALISPGVFLLGMGLTVFVLDATHGQLDTMDRFFIWAFVVTIPIWAIAALFLYVTRPKSAAPSGQDKGNPSGTEENTQD